jgi:hypothetical protein
MDAYYKTNDDHPPNNYQTIQKRLPHDDKNSNGRHASLACQPRGYASLGSPYHRIAFGRRERHPSYPSKSTAPVLASKRQRILVSLLLTRLNLKLTGKRRNNAFFELLKRLPTLRFADCHEMELPRRPFIHPFWNRALCDACRIDDKYRLITAYAAKKNYFLG